MFLDERKLNELIFVTAVNAIQLTWESGLAIDYDVIKQAVLNSLAVMMGDVVREYEYVDLVIEIAMDYLLKNEFGGFVQLAF